MIIKGIKTDWQINYYKGRIVATEAKVEVMQGCKMTVIEWDADRIYLPIIGRATAKAKETAYRALLTILLNRGHISEEVFSTAPKFA